MKILVTGGNGFIGSNFIKLVLEEKKGFEVVNIDSETYAGKGRNLEHCGISDNPQYKYYKCDIREKDKVIEIFRIEKPEAVVNFAAESHVDRSITGPEVFIDTNIKGTFNLLEASKEIGIKKFVQISTDEVYGSLGNDSPMSKEIDLLKPRSPYSASKAAAEHVALSYFHTFGLPVIVTRSSNNYGPYQFPEKLISLFVTNLIEGKKVPLMYSKDNPGLNIRDWLYVKDNCEAIFGLIEKGISGEIYNIAGRNEKTNMEITKAILSFFKKGEEMIEFIPHRKGHDFRYSVDDSKMRKVVLNLKMESFEQGILETINWYKNNSDWWVKLKK
jgi:dTDP-glucose 4,6-dehydratase